MSIHPSDAPKGTIPILPKGSPRWVRWVVIVGFLNFGVHSPFVAIPIAALVAALMSKGYLTW